MIPSLNIQRKKDRRKEKFVYMWYIPPVSHIEQNKILLQWEPTFQWVETGNKLIYIFRK